MRAIAGTERVLVTFNPDGTPGRPRVTNDGYIRAYVAPFGFNIRLLPARPIWSGLLVDAGVYAVMLMPSSLAFRGGRSLVRRWRGRCCRCGYDPVGLPPGAVCPECGAPVRALR
jgi:hypothetical protein